MYDLVLNFILDLKSHHQASRSNIEYHKLFPELEGIQINDLLDEMAGLAAPKYLDSKFANGHKRILYKNERTHLFKKEGGFKTLLAARASEQDKREAAIRDYTSAGFFAELHPTVRQVAGQYFVAGQFKIAVMETCTALSETVENKSGLTVDNTKLMQQAFSPENSILKLSNDRGERAGFHNLFMGVMMAVRNKLAHQSDDPYNQQTALEWLAFLSALFRLVDQAEVMKLPGY